MGFIHTTQSLINEIISICNRSGRNSTAVTLVAVSKTFPVEIINRYLEEVREIFSVPVLGENKVQEILSKKPHLKEHRLHLIGHLQTNKVKMVIPHIDYLQSLDSKKLADTLEKELIRSNRQLPVLIQANTTGETSKFGKGWEETSKLAQYVSSLSHLQLKGFMTLAPFTENKKIIRMCFQTLREWRDRLEEKTGSKLPELSMGMSHDYQIALEEGATMIRIGSAIFGKRDYKSDIRQ